ncbi:hypothetical protein N322_11621, partial [Cariama cristata]
NGHKLKYKKFHLNTRKHIFIVRVLIHWNRLPRKAVQFPSVKTFKTLLHTILGNLL